MASSVTIQPVGAFRPVYFEPDEGEYLDAWTWKVVDGWMEVEATFLCVARIRTVKYVVRAEWVEHICGIETTPQKDRR